jgi:hypothetical protein
MGTSVADRMPFDVAPGVAAALRDFELPERLGFGVVPAPVMFAVDCGNNDFYYGRDLPRFATICRPRETRLNSSP